METDTKKELDDAVARIEEQFMETKRSWDQLHKVVENTQEQHLDMLRRMGDLPTRTEMKHDLEAMEGRIANQINRLDRNNP